ncbi:MAG TPA: hypothetical protein VMT68_04445 [Caulobacteraceae bacterium]|nr:hypothetical protein [Caulobacteraceae bacterium]
MTFLRFAAAAAALAFCAGAASAASITAAEVREICKADFDKACPDAQPGHGALGKCARKHYREFDKPCQKALRSYHGGQLDQGAPSAATNAT